MDYALPMQTLSSLFAYHGARRVRSVALATLCLFIGAGTAMPSPLAPEALLERGIARFEAGQPGAAKRDLDAALAADPTLWDGYVTLLRIDLAQGDWPGAGRTLRRALGALTGPETRRQIQALIDALVARVQALLREHRPAEALALVREALSSVSESKALHKLYGEALMARGRELLAEGKTSEAIERFREAIRRTPQELAAYLDLARALFSNGRLSEALRALRDALRIDPENRDARDMMKGLTRV